MTCALLVIACPPVDIFVFDDHGQVLLDIGNYKCYHDSWLESTSDVFKQFRIRETSLFQLYTICFYFACAASVNVGFVPNTVYSNICKDNTIALLALYLY